MDVLGTVVSVELNATITKQNGGTYQGARLSFRDKTGKLVEQNFTSQTLKFNPSIANALSNLGSGENFVMVKEKEGEFWNVKSISIAGAQTVATAAPSNGKSFTPPPTPAKTGGNWESAEERANKQVYIIRQSNLTAAISTLSVGAKKLEVNDVLAVAKRYEDYVLGKNADLDSLNNATDIDFDTGLPDNAWED